MTKEMSTPVRAPMVLWLQQVWCDAERDALNAIAEGGSYTWTNPATGVVECGDDLLVTGRDRAIHIAQHSPAATLNRVRAERRHLEAHWAQLNPHLFGTVRNADDPPAPADCAGCCTGWSVDEDGDFHLAGVYMWPCPAWAFTAAGWSHLDGYDTAWFPMVAR